MSALNLGAQPAAYICTDKLAGISFRRYTYELFDPRHRRPHFDTPADIWYKIHLHDGDKILASSELKMHILFRSIPCLRRKDWTRVETRPARDTCCD